MFKYSTDIRYTNVEAVIKHTYMFDVMKRYVGNIRARVSFSSVWSDYSYCSVHIKWVKFSSWIRISKLWTLNGIECTGHILSHQVSVGPCIVGHFANWAGLVIKKTYSLNKIQTVDVPSAIVLAMRLLKKDCKRQVLSKQGGVWVRIWLKISSSKLNRNALLS